MIKGYCSPRAVCVREAKWTDKLERRTSGKASSSNGMASEEAEAVAAVSQ